MLKFPRKHGRREQGDSGDACPQDLAINKEVSFLFSENGPFLKEKMPSERRALPSLRSFLRPCEEGRKKGKEKKVKELKGRGKEGKERKGGT